MITLQSNSACEEVNLSLLDKMSLKELLDAFMQYNFFNPNVDWLPYPEIIKNKMFDIKLNLKDQSSIFRINFEVLKLSKKTQDSKVQLIDVEHII